MSSPTRPKAATVGVGRQVILRPAVQKRYVELDEPSLADQRPDLTRLLDARSRFAAFASPEFRIVRSTNPAVLAFLRGDNDTDGQVLCLFNFAGTTQTTTLSLPAFAGVAPRELMGGAEFPRIGASGEYDVGVVGRGFFWFAIRP